MEIEEKIQEKHFKCYNEALGMAVSKSYILNNKKCSKLGYIEKLSFLSLCLFVLAIILIMTSNIYMDYLARFLCLIIGIFIVMIATRILMYFTRNKKSYKTIINEEGITDESLYGIKMLFTWDKIKAVVINKHSIVILMDVPIFLYFSSVLEDKIVKSLKKYNKTDLIIKRY